MSWVQISNIIPAAIMAIFLAYIAWQQMLTNKNKFKLDLYNKRFEIYTDTLKFYQELMTEEVTKSTHMNFINSKEASMFLFSQEPSIYKLLEQMHSESFKIIGFKKHGKELSGSPEQFIKSNDNAQKTLQWFNDQMPILRNKMKIFLNQ
ncbi:MAG: hypothetical protein IMY67_11875 [Bacteroidetes bacterium]|nr:hypothetical protein [Bacteroidota bacterium]